MSSESLKRKTSSVELLVQSNSLTSLVSKLAFSSDEEDGKVYKEIYSVLGLTGDESERVSFSQFRRIISNNLDVDSSFMYKRVFNAFDRNQNGYLTAKELVAAVHVLLRGPFQAHINLGMRVYGKGKVQDGGDAPCPLGGNDDDFTISKSDAILSIVESLQLSSPRSRYTLTTDNREKAYHIGQDLVFIIYPKLDCNGDGVISKDDFTQACHEDPSLIQVFGQYLPRNTGVGPTPECPIQDAFSSTSSRPQSRSSLTSFQDIDYLKHSPTIGTMWGRQDKQMSERKSEKLSPIPTHTPSN